MAPGRVPLERARLAELVRNARRIAVVGLSRKPERPSHGVAAYLQRAGYTIIPVHPAGGVTLGEPVYPDLRSAALAAGPLDIVNIFRRSEHVPEIVDAAIRIGAKSVWMQEGVVHDGAAAMARAAGLEVVMDRCILKEHRALVSDR
jgi:predicted CoA-binding protein